MKKVSLSGSSRTNVGKKDAADIRRAGNVPCVIYGGEKQIAFSASEKELKKIIWSPDVYEVNLSVDGNNFTTVIQDLQFHPVTDKVVHVDFLQVIPGKDVKVRLPLKLKGNAEGVKKGGKLIQNFRKVKVKGLIEKLPESLTVSVDHLDIGDDVRVRDLKFDGITILEQDSAVVAAVKLTRNVAAEETPAATPSAAAPSSEPKK